MANSEQKKIGQEYIGANEQQIFAEMVEEMEAQVDRMYAGKRMKRQVHTKMHGCVKAKFEIEPNLSDELRVGVFQEPKTYHAWVRFSNASTVPKPDKKKDIRGAAIKLMGVPGEKILAGEQADDTQDFLLMSSETFFSKNVEEFSGTLRAATSASKLSLALYFLNPMHWGLLGRFVKTQINVENPLDVSYWSTQPYRYGGDNTAVKYFMKPTRTNTALVDNLSDPDFLRVNMEQTLFDYDMSFDFFVQFQTNADTMPIEDPTIPWSSPFQKVATLTIPKQQFDSKEQWEYGENLSFNPWHSLPEHQPLGGFNRARKLAYITLSKYRHKWNDVPMFEPKDTPDFLSGDIDPKPVNDVPVPEKGILKRSAKVLVNCTPEQAFDYIASAEKLPDWLKKKGVIPGAESVDIVKGPYNFVGARRKVIFQGGDSAFEQLLSHHPPKNYSYRITKFSNFLKKLSDAAYGQLWFDEVGGQTRITWVYSFTYKSFLSRVFLSLFLSLSYRKFMQASLKNAKEQLEKDV